MPTIAARLTTPRLGSFQNRSKDAAPLLAGIRASASICRQSTYLASGDSLLHASHVRTRATRYRNSSDIYSTSIRNGRLAAALISHDEPAESLALCWEQHARLHRSSQSWREPLQAGGCTRPHATSAASFDGSTVDARYASAVPDGQVCRQSQGGRVQRRNVMVRRAWLLATTGSLTCAEKADPDRTRVVVDPLAATVTVMAMV